MLICQKTADTVIITHEVKFVILMTQLPIDNKKDTVTKQVALQCFSSELSPQSSSPSHIFSGGMHRALSQRIWLLFLQEPAMIGEWI